MIKTEEERNMAIPVLIMGKSGSGKTYSLKNFKNNEIGIISVEKGRLPFKSDLKVVKIPKTLVNPDKSNITSYGQLNRAKYAWIESVIQNSKVKSIAIDDSQFLLVNELFDRSGEKGYDKFTDMAKNFKELIHFINELPEDDKIVYLLHHSETGVDGREKCKTIGKMLEEKLVLEGLFDIVLYCADHKFYTQSNELSTAKTPDEMFEGIEIENDLKSVDVAIRDFYGLAAAEPQKKSKTKKGE